MYKTNSDALRVEIRALKRTYEAMVFLFDNGDGTSAYHLTQLAFERLAQFEDFWQKADQTKGGIKSLIKKFAAELDEDQVQLQKYSNLDKSTLTQNEDFYRLILKFRTSLGWAQKINRILFHLDPDFISYLKKHKKILLRSILVVLVIVVPLIVYLRYLSGRHGLKGEYYKSQDLLDLYLTRIDKTIYFDWGKKSPLPGFNKNRFSIRWTGFIYAPESGNYYFLTRSDDGVRLWIDDELLIDDWRGHSELELRRIHNLNKGYHTIKLEYFDDSADASIKLLWKKPSDRRPERISGRYFVHDGKYIKDKR